MLATPPPPAGDRYAKQRPKPKAKKNFRTIPVARIRAERKAAKKR